MKNGRVYFGSTISIKKRFSDHLRKLRAKIHPNTFLQNDFNKCGEEVFKFETLELVENVALLSVEQKYLDQNYDNQQKCYNICPVAGNHLGLRHSEETKRKMSQVAKGKKKSPCHVQKMTETKRALGSKLIYQYDLEGNLLASWLGLRNASKLTNIAHPSILSVLKQKRIVAGKSLWSYEENKGDFLRGLYLAMRQKEARRKSLQLSLKSVLK